MKSITDSQDRQNFDSAHTICNLHLCHNFLLVLHENALIFSQSEARNIFCLDLFITNNMTVHFAYEVV